ncbi:Signal transduction histidine-protein kinase ArlS [Pseudoalteromonas sp. THAF3]|uniref:sensor histidine kinase n=1 Tax=Pseudoalteromonas sp. THAF3 TaxID=2587843 RepID=UPI00126802DE|nr:ATP-binding protein [Pseudoalteromonas sp. THAF3]QFU06171.1 Signal transduction histidine-protein kinase ArlS [Pseudoalteromonas sp. THAF3]
MIHWWRRTSFVALLIVLTINLLAGLLDHYFLPKTGVLLLLQLAVVVCTFLSSTWVSILAACLCALSFNFFFTAPQYTLHMNDGEDIISVLVFFIIGLLTSYAVGFWRRQKHRLALAELRTSMLMSVSHDLRTPLAAVMGALETLQTYTDKLEPQEREELLASARAQSERLYRYIENILQATRFELDQGVSLIRSKQPLMPIIESVCARFDVDEVRISHSLSDLKLSVQAPLLEQAFHNVIDNAVSFNEGNAPVDVSVTASTDNILIQIHDEGPGVPKAYRDEIFKPFTSLREKESSDAGTGVGLTVAQSIIRAHGGDISLVPSASGCTMQITLPTKRVEQ